MNAELLAQIEQMSEEELNAILETEFPEELEKQAAAQVAEESLINSLYAYGALSAERAYAEIEGEGDLSKVASAEEIENHENAEAEVGAIIEAAITELGLAEIENEVEMHKTAQACAAVIFDGYSDTLEKIAAKKGKAAGGVVAKVKELGQAMSAQLKKGKNATVKHVKNHAVPYALGSGALVGAAAMKGKEMLDKRAAEMTVGELAAAINGVNEIEAGIQKLAAKGGKKGASLWKTISKTVGNAKDSLVENTKAGTKHVKKHALIYGGGLAGLGAGASLMKAYQDAKKKD